MEDPQVAPGIDFGPSEVTLPRILGHGPRREGLGFVIVSFSHSQLVIQTLEPRADFMELLRAIGLAVSPGSERLRRARLGGA
mmetsp:Transcript_15655/g.37126  ORF Transcript_15655/g.37126 Transcript_15655/m.37126 type:complete len:82 (-) Transcript_15655:121-366(-)